MAKTVTERWSWHFDGPPEAVWSALADTARFNEAAGFPKHRIETVTGADGTIAYIGSARFGPLAMRWRDIPVEWVANERFVHCREFIEAPLARLCASLALARDGAGTRADYTLEIEPRTLLGRIAAWRIVAGARTSYAGLIASARDYVSERRAVPFDVPPPALGAEARVRLDGAVAAIEQSVHGHGLARRLADYVTTAPEVDIRHLRPLRLAAAWRIGTREAVELCLAAVKAGMLGMEWNILCPRCRGAKTTATTLDALPEAGHCDSCNIAYGRDFSRNVELTFHPAPAIRPIASGEFCLFGPMSVPHVKLQQTLAPGETRRVALSLPPGDYRLRPLNAEGGADVSWAGGGFPTVVAGDGGVEAGAPAEPGSVVMVNRDARARTVVVEHLHWQRDALTAHRVTTMQTFRDLFEAEVLRPGDEVAIERVALMFTDLRGSTALYTRIGDARAYGLVRRHFAYLAQKVRHHNGAVVKTIGDAVMAAFADPGDAMRAALDVQRSVAAFNAEQRHGGIVIKLGLHEGPSIAVTLNGRLDYFGTTVNMAARLQAESAGGDIVLSPAIAADPAVTPLLAGLSAREQVADLKGFDAPVPFLRIDAAALETGAAQESTAAASRSYSSMPL